MICASKLYRCSECVDDTNPQSKKDMKGVRGMLNEEGRERNKSLKLEIKEKWQAAKEYLNSGRQDSKNNATSRQKARPENQWVTRAVRL